MASALLFIASALLCSGQVVESLYCKECLVETDDGRCLITAGTCKAAETCMTIMIYAEKEVKFRVYGCFVSDHYHCGMRKKTGGHTLNVRCCAGRHLCNKKFHF
nr:uncharacterized protein LOC110091189 isoform X2 [Pogona vitticeps]